MALFKINKNKVERIKEKSIDLERDLQKITENNLEEIFGLKFVSSEMRLNNFRIDTLAFNPEQKSFVIIEYKKDRSFSVVDQGYSYLSLMLNNKADFVLEYNEKTMSSLRRDDIDWNQSRVIFIANSFTVYQQNAINFKDLPFELWEAKKFEENLVSYNKIKTPESSETINVIAKKNKNIEIVSREIKNYTVEGFFKKDWNKSLELFEKIREQIKGLDANIEEKPVKNYIGYNINNWNVVVVRVRKNKLYLRFPRIEPKDIEDPKNKLKYEENSLKFFNTNISYLSIDSDKDIDYAMYITKQVYKKFRNDKL